MSDTDTVFKPNPNQSSQSSTCSTNSQSSGRIVLDAEVHGMYDSHVREQFLTNTLIFLSAVQSPLLPGGIHQQSILHYGTGE